MFFVEKLKWLFVLCCRFVRLNSSGDSCVDGFDFLDIVLIWLW